jgi:deoxyribonuclease V
MNWCRLPSTIFSRTSRWPKTVPQARAVQEALRNRVVTRDRVGRVRHVAGIDVGFEREGRITRAAVVVLRFPELVPVEQAVVRQRTRFPYVPGYLSFREIPAVLAALARLAVKPDLLLCDGQGYAHPRRFGLACHLGVLTNTPSIGVAKSRLIGEHDALAVEKGSWVPLRDQGEVIGAVLRTRTDVNPLYVSLGHRVSLRTAIRYVLACTTKYRLPETTRLAHRLASHDGVQAAASPRSVKVATRRQSRG